MTGRDILIDNADGPAAGERAKDFRGGQWTNQPQAEQTDPVAGLAEAVDSRLSFRGERADHHEHTVGVLHLVFFNRPVFSPENPLEIVGRFRVHLGGVFHRAVHLIPEVAVC